MSSIHLFFHPSLYVIHPLFGLSSGVFSLADHALIAYLKIIADINRSPKVLSYRSEPRLQDPDHEPFKVDTYLYSSAVDLCSSSGLLYYPCLPTDHD